MSTFTRRILSALSVIAALTTVGLYSVACSSDEQSAGTTTEARRSQTVTPEAQTLWGDLPLYDHVHADIVVYGKVTKIDPGQWNTPDGEYREPDDPTGESIPAIYRTYYVEPSEILKGEAKWGTPIAFIVLGGDENKTSGPVTVGDTVLILGCDYMAQGGLYDKVTWRDEAYFAMQGDKNVFVLIDGTLTKSVYLTSDGRVHNDPKSIRGGTVSLEDMRTAIAAEKTGTSIQWYENVTTITGIGAQD